MRMKGKTLDEYINPNFVCELLEVIETYYGVPDDRDYLWDYVEWFKENF